MKRYQRMLIVCSGAVENLLEQDDCRADAKKYAMIGAFVLLTAVFAFFSSTFALYTGVGSLPLAILLGVAWALMIFTLDRFVVSGVRKSDVSALTPQQQVFRRFIEWLIALPRILLAALISVAVATPLELRFFQSEIDAQITKNHTLSRQAAGDDLDQEFREIPELRQKNDELAKSTQAAWTEHSAAERLAAEELAGQALTHLSGAGPVYLRLQAHADDLRRQTIETEKNNAAVIAANNARIDELVSQRQRRLIEAQNAIDKSGGFLARYAALGQLTALSSDVRIARTFFMLLFLTIELTPVVMKLLLRRGPYDDFVETLEHRVNVAELLKRSHTNDDAHAEVALHSRKNTERVLLEETLTRETFDFATVSKVAAHELEEAQMKLAKASIQAWLRQQMAAFGPRPQVPIRKPPRASTPASQPDPAHDSAAPVT